MRRVLRGRVAVVTGGAQGIGAALAAAMAAEGIRVAIGDLDGDSTAAAAAGLATPGLGLALDVTDPESFRGFLDEVTRRLGPVDILVNNAGVMWVGPWEQESDTIAAHQVDVNVHGVVRGMKLVLPGMVARRRGHVVTIASAASLVAPPGEAMYAATKHAVHGYSRAVAEEIRGSGVHITVVMPTVVDTELAVGTAHGLTPRLSTAQVASAVVSALRRPRFAVFVPPTLGAYLRVAALLPGPLRDRFLRATVPDQTRLTDRRQPAGTRRAPSASNPSGRRLVSRPHEPGQRKPTPVFSCCVGTLAWMSELSTRAQEVKARAGDLLGHL